MSEATTTTIMVAIFVTIGICLPVFLMMRDKTQQSTLSNKLILWIAMIFCMVMVFGIVIDFQQLSDSIRGDLVQYGFIALMLFGGIFGIDQLLKSHYIKTIQWRDFKVTSSGGKNEGDGNGTKEVEEIVTEQVESGSGNEGATGDNSGKEGDKENG